VGEAGSPTTWSSPDLSEMVTRGQNYCTEMGDHIRLKSATLLSTNFKTVVQNFGYKVSREEPSWKTLAQTARQY